jgi:hypothetical protein
MRRVFWTVLAFGVLTGPAAGQGHDLGPGAFLSGSGSASGNGLWVYQQVGCSLPAQASGGGYGIHGGVATTIIGAATLELMEAPATNPAGHLVTVTARSSAPSFAGPPGGTLYHRPGGGSSVTPVVMFSAGDSLGALIPGAAFGDRGLEFYLSARVGGVTLTVPRGDPLANPLRIESQLSNYTAGGALATVQETYRMISFGAAVNPATVASVLEDDLGAANKEMWRFGRWNPQLGTSGAYSEYLGSEGDVSPIAGGNAYWLITRDPALIDFSGLSRAPVMTPRGILGFQITLKPGWNQIGNPFAFTVNPSSISVVLGTDVYTFAGAIAAGVLEASPLRAYDAASGTYPSASLFEPWTGYFVNNADPAERDMIWTIPNQATATALRDDEAPSSVEVRAPRIVDAQPQEPTENAGARRSVRHVKETAELKGRALRGVERAAASADLESDGLVWSLNVAAVDAQGSGGSVVLGLADAAAATLDPWDRLAVPGPPGEVLQLACRNENMPLRSQDLIRDVRSLAGGVQDGNRWCVVVTCAEPGPVQLSLYAPGPLPGNAKARLVDAASGRHVDLEEAALYEFVAAPSSRTRELLVLVGSEEYVESQTQSADPRDLRFALGPLSPNPARSSPYLEFSLPEETQAQLRIYDVSGRLVAALVEDVLPAGRHVIAWDRRAQSGRPVASGVYYVRLTAGARSQVGKLVVIR